MKLTLPSQLPVPATEVSVAVSNNYLPQHVVSKPVLRLFGIDINNVLMNEAVEFICHSLKQSIQTKIAFVNADCVNQYLTDQGYFDVLRGFEYIFADGIGVRIAANLIGTQIKDNVNGTDLFPVLCRRLEKTNHSIYFFGAGPGVAQEMAAKLRETFPKLKIAGYSDGYSHKIDDKHLIERINSTQPDVILVALGAPAQEKWIAQNAPFLNSKVLIGVGGLFDFYSGRIKRAPKMIRRASLEWAWRLLMEPRKKAKRYLIGNPLFIYRILKLKHLNTTTLHDANIVKNRSVNHSLGLVKFKLWSLNKYIAPIVKRTFDAIASTILLLFLMPLLIFTSCLIWLDSPGNVFYRQDRVGKLGKTFSMWKFRSMYIDSDKVRSKFEQNNEMENGIIFKIKDDPRITRIGRFIRKSSIDELPQLFNVLTGDMSLVGPRPPLPGEVAKYTHNDRERLTVKPGITCLWQVSGRSDIPFSEQVKLDINYIEKQSFFMDMQILLKTIPAVLSGKGAY